MIGTEESKKIDVGSSHEPCESKPDATLSTAAEKNETVMISTTAEGDQALMFANKNLEATAEVRIFTTPASLSLSCDLISASNSILLQIFSKRRGSLRSRS